MVFGEGVGEIPALMELYHKNKNDKKRLKKKEEKNMLQIQTDQELIKFDFLKRNIKILS